MSKKVTEKHTGAAAKNRDMVFGKENYRYLIIGVLVILLGFILMSGTEDILDFRKLTLAPIVTLAGFGIVIAAILKKTKD